MKTPFLILFLSLLFYSCTQDSPLTVEFRPEPKDLTSLNAEIASFLDLTYDETGLITKVAEQIRIQKLDEANLTSEELIARLDVSEEELTQFSEKMSALQSFVNQKGYSQEEVSVSLKMQLADRFASFEKGTPCYDLHELEVAVATVAMVACNAVAALSGGWGIAVCTTTYVAVVGTSRVKYEICINK